MPAINKQRGIALVIVLWLLVLLSIIAAAYSKTTRTETRVAAHFVQAARARALAEAGIWLAVNELLKPEPGQRWRKDGSLHKTHLGEAEITLQIQDEAGKIDLNSARRELLFSLLQSLNLQLEAAERLKLLQKILDWRDRDNLVGQEGAEDAEYARLGLDYGAKDGPFNSTGELQLIPGITPEIYRKLRPALTVHSHQPGINPEVAPRAVLLALPGGTPDLVENYLAGRGPGGTASTALTGVDPRYFSRVRGNTFSITSTGRGADSRYSIVAVVSVKRNATPPFSVLSWAENSLSLSLATDTKKD